MFVVLFGCTKPASTRHGAALPASSTAPVPLPAPVRLPAPATYTLQDVRLSSTPESTQVTLMVNGPVQPLVQRLARPDRLQIDLLETALGPQWSQQSIPVADGRLSTVQMTQSQANRVRITLALQSIRDYRVKVQSAPHRLTVELLGPVTTAHTRARTAQQSTSLVTLAPSPRAEQPLRSHNAPLICIDPGHGGHDPGAIGPTGLPEKTVVLQVAKELRQLIHQAMPPYRVMLTREEDVFVPLAERARMANEHQAQLFISIHANSSPRSEARGIETWYLSFAASARARQIAARENRMSEQQLSTLELILRDMHETDRINRSAVLAQSTQKGLVEYMARQYPGIIPRGVEGAPFAVLHRTTMPSVLVEISFISNPQEEARLRTPQYQRALAQGILQGLRQFLQTAIVAMD